MSNTNYPTSYSLFKPIAELRKHKQNKKELTRFVFRYRLAKSFNGINAEGIGRTLEGYNSVVKLFLTYTAYEQLLRASIGLNVFGILSIEKNNIVDIRLADKLRKNSKLIDFLVEHSIEGTLLSKLISFRKNTNNDVVCVAYAIRNIFAHGELTATAIGTSIKSERDALYDLADVLLNYCDENFTKCIEKLR
jgi:hypothetical protein